MKTHKILTKQVHACVLIAIVIISGWLAGCSLGLRRKVIPNPGSMQIRIPETETSVTLDHTAHIDDSVFLQGDYSIAHGPDIIERGTVALDTASICEISSVDIPSTDQMLLAACFTVSPQGSGVFSYVGLFVFDPDTETFRHQDSYFLGDRIRRIRLRDVGRAVKVSFMKHATDQAMVQTPEVPAAVNVYVQNDLTWRPYPGMHPSWDKNNDGINDCEDDGICDHTIDYTIARDDESF